MHIIQYFLEEEDEAEGEVVPIPRAPRRHFLRDREGKARQLFNDYFSDTHTFPLDRFWRRFRMSKSLFIRICRGIINFNQEPIPDYITYFKQRRDATGLYGFNVFQKCTFAIRQLAYGVAPDAFDECLHMGESTSYLYLKNFSKSVLHLYSDEYLRRPNAHDVQRLISKHEDIHGFTGSNNDINVLNQSDLLNEILKDMSPQCNYTVNGLQFTRGYYLADAIYPECSGPSNIPEHVTDPQLNEEEADEEDEDNEDEEDEDDEDEEEYEDEDED
ncbi:uncharacterized protein [Rutidosis leptorrhynchoides]|uniref:uncharacterized protein n=1 Tax=Rutidosis leptorrhynchoides TaxID=125765 RepID=UPI003A99A8F9